MSAGQSMLAPRRRNRGWYLFGFLAAILTGLASRHFPGLLSPLFGKYPGDALWALMVFFGCGWLWRTAPSLAVAGLALAFSCAIEFLKLWPSAWWAAIRHSTIGHLIFGHAFSWQNLVAYLIGIAGGLVIEIVIKPGDAKTPGAGGVASKIKQV